MMEHLDPELLSAYIDHELPAADVAAVERHLADCATCRTEYEELRGLSTLVRELPVYQPRRVIDVSAHPRGGSDTLAKIIAFSKPLAIAALVLLVAFAGLRLLTDDEPDDAGDQISFSEVQPTQPGTEGVRQASEEEAAEAPADAARSESESAAAPDAAAPSDSESAEAPPAAAPSDSEALGEAPPPMGAMGALPSGPPGTVIVDEPRAAASPTPVATVAPTAAPAPEPEPAGEGDSWLPEAIVATVIVALAGVAGWYRFVRRPRRNGT